MVVVAAVAFLVVRRGDGDGAAARAAASGATAPGATTAATGKAKAKRKAKGRAKAKPVVALGTIAPAVPGVAEVVDAGPASRRLVALTFDDGYCAECVKTLVRAVERTGARVTFCPNGTYAAAWEAQRRTIRKLLAAGQITLCNHTFTHADLRKLDAASIRQELERNEAWIEKTFGVTSRPWFRPPYGAYDAEVLQVAGELGYTRIAMWSGTVADSNQRGEDYIVDAIRTWAKPGAIILAHANHPATANAFERMLKVLEGRNLKTATLPEIAAA